MGADIIDGKAAADAVYGELAGRVEKLRAGGVTPGIAFVRVGEDPASVSYVRSKEKAAGRLGVLSRTFVLPKDSPAEVLERRLQTLNSDERFHGLLLQLPLPEHIAPRERYFLDLIRPEKDVDGFTSHSLGLLMAGTPSFVPATPRGVMTLLSRAGVDPAGKHAVIVGRSVIVGRPMAMLLAMKAKGSNATVTIVHTGTPDPGSLTRQADILVVAAGKAGVVTGDMVKTGAVVIDVGINRVEDGSGKRGYRLAGDVDFDAACQVASAITPVPGGVGLMTVASLMENVVEAAGRGLDEE